MLESRAAREGHSGGSYNVGGFDNSIHSVVELPLVVRLVNYNLHNLHQTSVVTRVHLVIQIQWIFQMTISHSKNGQNELNI